MPIHNINFYFRVTSASHLVFKISIMCYSSICYFLYFPCIFLFRFISLFIRYQFDIWTLNSICWGEKCMFNQTKLARYPHKFSSKQYWFDFDINFLTSLISIYFGCVFFMWIIFNLYNSFYGLIKKPNLACFYTAVFFCLYV